MESLILQAQLYIYINADAMASSSNATAGQLFLVSFNVCTLFDLGENRSFISSVLALRISNSGNKSQLSLDGLAFWWDLQYIILLKNKYRILLILTPSPCQKIYPKTAKGVRLCKKFENFKIQKKFQNKIL